MLFLRFNFENVCMCCLGFCKQNLLQHKSKRNTKWVFAAYEKNKYIIKLKRNNNIKEKAENVYNHFDMGCVCKWSLVCFQIRTVEKNEVT